MSPLGAWGALTRCVGRASVLCAMACALGLAWGASEQPEPASGRQASAPARFARQAVVSAHPEASRAGAFILANGGNAIDAAVATQFALSVVEPQSSGLGGGGFAVVFDGREVWAYDGREAAPRAVDEQLFVHEGQVMSFEAARRSPRSVGAPGTVPLLWRMHQRHGRLAWSQLLKPAIDLAEHGFVLTPRLHQVLDVDPLLRLDSQALALFYDPDGRPKPVGTRLRNPELGWVLRQVSQRGPQALQSGRIAQAMLHRMQAGQPEGSSMSLQDLKEYEVRVSPALCFAWRASSSAPASVNTQVCGAPPPSSGTLAVGQILGLLEARPETSAAITLGAPWVHQYTEAARLAFADRAQYVGDPAHVPAPAGAWSSLLDERYLHSRALAIGPQRQPKVQPGTPQGQALSWGPMPDQPEAGTTHLNAVDAKGRAVAMTHTVESAFGSRRMVNTGQGRPGGFLLNHELTDFALSPRDAKGQPLANAPGSAKRPRSSMSPLLVLQRDTSLPAATPEVIMAVGSAGGPFIIHHVAQTLWALKHWGLSAQEASALPRWGLSDPEGPLWLESGTAAQEWAAALESLGHPVRVAPMTSGVHLLVRDAQGSWSAGADPRREGQAQGK